MERINPTLPAAACSEAIEKLRSIESGSTIQRNRRFMDYLQNGVPVSYFAEGEQRSALMHLVDNGNVANNSFVVANQWTVVGNSEKDRMWWCS